MGKLVKQSKDRNTYTFMVELPRGADGKRRQKRFTVHGNLKQCKEQKARIELEVLQGTHIEPSKMTLGEFMEQWLDVAVLPHREALTYESYAYDVRHYVLPRIGRLLLGEVSPLHIEKLYAELATRGRQDGTGLALTTRKRVHNTLHRAFKIARRWRLITVNPMEEVEPPKGPKQRPGVYTQKEVEQLLAHAHGHVLYLPCALAVLAGLRRGEILGLRWQDIDFDGRVLQVRKSVEDTRRFGPRSKLPKNNRERQVTLSRQLLRVLREHQQAQAVERKRLGAAWQDRDLVYPNDDGTLRDPGSFSSMFHRLVETSGMRRLPFHSLRHAHATLLLEANVPLKAASERLGHSTIAITADLYTHVLDSMQREVADKLDELGLVLPDEGDAAA